MNWKVFTATFITIFLAELGDKTQFVALAASSQTTATLSVLLATVLALTLAGSIGVLVGSLLGDAINPQILKYLSGSAFILMGLFILLKK